MATTIETTAAPARRAFAVNDATAGTAFTNPSDSTTPPSGDGVFQFGAGGSVASNGMMIVPFGTDTDAQTFLLGAFGWKTVIGSVSGAVKSYTAVMLASFVCTISTALPGLAGTNVTATDYYCDIITLGVGNANISNEIISPTTDVKASLLLDCKGCDYIQLKILRNASAVSGNALVSKL